MLRGKRRVRDFCCSKIRNKNIICIFDIHKLETRTGYHRKKKNLLNTCSKQTLQIDEQYIQTPTTQASCLVLVSSFSSFFLHLLLYQKVSIVLLPLCYRGCHRISPSPVYVSLSVIHLVHAAHHTSWSAFEQAMPSE